MKMRLFAKLIVAAICLVLMQFYIALMVTRGTHQTSSFQQHQQTTPKDTSTIPGACQTTKGILHIRMGDIGGAAGTIFFQFVIGQILYAKRNNLTPWVHFDNTSYIVYDERHTRGPGATIKAMVGRNATRIINYQGHWRDQRPGPLDETMPVRQETLHFPGMGVWTDYFEPVSDFVPGDKSCENKLYVTLDLKLITPGIHGFSKWAPKCWRYHYLPDYATQPHIPITEWLEPQRKIGNIVARKYIRPKPYLQKLAEEANPNCTQQNPCLGLHIRHSDKAAGRRQVPLEEFLPYVKSYILSGGQNIYLATDSHKVIEEINQVWPKDIQRRIRTLPNVVRSTDDKAVFDIGSHHRVNTEILTEIYALAKCQYMIHGFSAVSESAIWENYRLHMRGVNLEDPERLNSAEFGTLVQMDLKGFREDELPKTKRTDSWWQQSKATGNTRRNNFECTKYKGIMLIMGTGDASSAPKAFFASVLNQLQYADTHMLMPIIHLQYNRNVLYEASVHGLEGKKMELRVTVIASGETNPGDAATTRTVHLDTKGNGIWNTYFVGGYGFDALSGCTGMKLYMLSDDSVSPEFLASANWTIKSWRYDNVTDKQWHTDETSSRDFLHESRDNGRKLVQKYFSPADYIMERAETMNPGDTVCLAVHLRNGDKKGKFRRKLKADVFRPYMEAFIEAGGDHIFVASDSHRPLQYIQENFPKNIVDKIRSTGPYVARTFKEWPSSMIDRPHRITSEVLADILAMAKCRFFLHGHSTTSEAVIYYSNNTLGDNFDLEDAQLPSLQDFRGHVRHYMVQNLKQSPSIKVSEVTSKRVDNTTILLGSPGRAPRENAIIFLAQKHHSTYNRDSYGNLLEALNLVNKNYLSINDHIMNTDIIIFHTGDFNETDLTFIESHLGEKAAGALRLIDLAGSDYWARPHHMLDEDSSTWKVMDLFPEGYRHMIHWFAIKIWQYFGVLEKELGWNYRYILRLDEDSYIHSPIKYDIFDFMKQREYVYGFRMCAYEMKINWRMWFAWNKTNGNNFRPYRDHDKDLCGFYNNFFVANIDFFRQEKVQRFLNFIDNRGHIYRRRLGDLNIHSMAVYAYARPEQIHRFLDFSYEHKTVLNKTAGCINWGGIQTGFNDENASNLMLDYYNSWIMRQDCSPYITNEFPREMFYQASFLSPQDLSPTYQHLSDYQKSKVHLHTMASGDVELAHKGILSG